MPLRETDEDRENEEAIANLLLPCFDCDNFEKLPRYLSLDYVLCRDRDADTFVKVEFDDEEMRDAIVFVEAKFRWSIPFGYGEGYWIAMNKVTAAKQFIEMGYSSYLAVRFPNASVHMADFRDVIHRPRIVVDGRRDRKDEGSVEPLVVVPWNRFELIGYLY
jgi:hypothetical protein